MNLVVDRLASGDAQSRLEADGGACRRDPLAFVEVLEHLCCPVDLCNWLGRLPTLWRRAAIETFGESWAKLDPRLRGNRLNTGRWAAWYRDQYRHPHESRHSMGEVERWFERSGIETLMSIPPAGGENFTEDTRLFAARARRKGLDYFVSELEMLLTGGTDGGLYMMIGRKKDA